MRRFAVTLLCAVMLVGLAVADDVPIRFATFNAALTEDEPGALIARLEGGSDRQAELVAETIQRIRPDVLLLQEIDRDPDGRSLDIFRQQYLAVGQNGAEPIDYPHVVFPPANTGVPLGLDVNGDGTVGGPNDAAGFGNHPGQFAFAILSRLPLGHARTYADFLWRDMPGNLMPESYYSPAAQAVVPLSSKTHVAVPVETSARPIYVIAAHPTPPVFDDARDWNGRRNSDEIRLMVDIADDADYLMDDAGVPGGLRDHAGWIAMGDLNADPAGGDSREAAISQLLAHPDIAGGPDTLAGVPTATFGGGLRVDYVLPSTDAGTVTDAGVVAFEDGAPLARLNQASDHRMVWVDLVPAEPASPDGGVEAIVE